VHLQANNISNIPCSFSCSASASKQHF
jgi:hypothetical protein